MEPDLFTAAAEDRQEKDPSSSPLAVRMRPRTLDEVVGQQHLLKPGSPLRRLVGEGGGGPAGPSSVILWGPPGTGKTTLAYVVAKATNKRFVELSAITAGVKEVRAVIDGARRAAGGVRQGDRPLPRRDPPLQQGPAGLAAARRGEPLGDPDRRDHREPVLLGDLPAAVPLAAAHPGTAHRRRPARRCCAAR